MRLYLYFFALLLLGSCTESTSVSLESATPLDESIAAAQKQFIPDRRVNRLEVTPRIDGQQWVLTGYTTLPQAKTALLAQLAGLGILYTDSIAVLPHPDLGEDTLGLAKHSVVNLRSEPGHSQELASQALLGTPLRVLQQQAEWFMVQTPDGYISWMHGGELARKNAAEMQQWKAASRVIVVAGAGHSYQAASTVAPVVGDITSGAIFELVDAKAGFSQVKYPDGRLAFVASAMLQDFDAWLDEQTLANERVFNKAKRLVGVPYLWGGTSPKGMDCSGFTKTVYFQNGLIIPRDASQQVHAGQEVEITPQLDSLQAGDFLFFGGFREDGSEKITHVGIYLGNGRFIHSGSDNGAVLEQSLLPEDPDFAEKRRQTLLRARRMLLGSTGVVSIKEHGWY